MNELTRSLLASAREGLAPDPAIAARVRARVDAAVGAGPVAKPIPAGSSGVLLKLGAVALIAAVVVVGTRHRAPSGDAPRLQLSAAHDEPVQPSVTVAAHENPARPAATPVVFHAEPASLSREVELIDQAMAALRARDPNAALTAMHTFDRETLGHAQMAEEAAAITIEAHCGLGDDVSARLDAFDRAWPDSAERSRITDACR